MSEGHETLFAIEFAATPAQLQGLRRQLDDCLKRIDLSRTLREQLVLAVNEACMNIIQHAYHGRPGETIRLSLEAEPGRLLFLLDDDAACIDPASVKPRDLADIRPGGLGVHFIREIMDEMRFHPCHERGNRLELVKHLEPGFRS